MPIWTQIPGKVEYPFVLNDASPQAEGLVGWWPGAGAGGKLFDVSGRGNNGTLSDFPTPFTASNGWGFGKDGGKGAIVGTSAGATQRVALARAITGLASWSMTVWYKPNVYYFQHSDALAGDYYGHANRPTPTIFGYNGGTGKQKWTVTGTVASTTIDYDMDLNTWYFVGVTSDRTTVRFFINGKEVGSSATDIGTMQVYGLYTYDATFGGNPLQGTADDFCLYNRCLSSGEIAQKYDPRTRWELRHIPQQYFLCSPPAGGGGNQTVTPTTASLTISTFAPTVSTPRLCTPTTAALTLTTFAPTVRIGATVTPTTLALTIATFAPTVSTPRLCTPTTLAFTITMFAPTMAINRTVTPTTLSFTLTTFAPTIRLPKLCTPTTLALSITSFAPTVTGGQGLTVTPTTLALTTTTFAPTIINPKSATPTTLALLLSTFAPTILTPRTVTPTTLALSLTTFAPTITVSAGTTVTPTTLALALTTFAPTITNPQTYVPTTLAFVLTGLAPTVTVAPVDTGPPNRVGGGGQGGGPILGYQMVEIDFDSEIERAKSKIDLLKLREKELLLEMKIRRMKDEDELIYLGVF